MPDSPDQKPKRSAADKERSRQQSRQVSARQAGRAATAQQGRNRSRGGGGSRGGAGGGSGTSRGPSGKGGQRPKGGRPAQRPAAQGRRSASGPRRSSTAPLTWGIVGLVLVIVIVLVVVKLTGSSSTTNNAPPAQTVPASVLSQVTNVPASVFNTVGVSSPSTQVTPPTVEKGQATLTYDGKPGYLFVGGEFCPFCAAERWGVIAGLSRFGTFSGLQTMQSAATDEFPSTQTFTFAHATYTSKYLSARLVEHFSNQKNSAGTAWQVLDPLTKAEQKTVSKFDKTSSSTSSGSIPFATVGNKVVMPGASYSPSILAGLTRAQIATGLHDAKNPVTQAIIATANYLSAGVCAIDGAQPADVCTSKGVAAATKALGLGS